MCPCFVLLVNKAATLAVVYFQYSEFWNSSPLVVDLCFQMELRAQGCVLLKFPLSQVQPVALVPPH